MPIFQQHYWKTAESITAWHGSSSILIRLLHSAHVMTGCRYPIAVLNDFEVIIFAATTTNGLLLQA